MHILHTVLYIFPKVLIRRVFQSRTSLVDNHFLYSHDFNVWFRWDIVRRNWILITLKSQRVKYSDFNFVLVSLAVTFYIPFPVFNKKLKIYVQQYNVKALTSLDFRDISTHMALSLEGSLPFIITFFTSDVTSGLSFIARLNWKEMFSKN